MFINIGLPTVVVCFPFIDLCMMVIDTCLLTSAKAFVAISIERAITTNSPLALAGPIINP
uniref:Uncharacterized protein n=1 Tax=Candidatus Kentrum sp. MB TaxID=2138164 RepID=A0A450X6Y0_9GAMM|nr:MAG: hypothetical protein BECKMB1821G_GA0114241_101116 [Candidatus Kentron sp. MB]VFK29795.1 MAG: hypothetical protein BECKMB1821I_GA0114274_10126 [Candidatus Kentron sp. MB]VFK74948.1 MAG: hypothetical protein BECKMB1821H_GA0114242_10136 [Candidatus Kentron sp. MB]